MEASIDQQIFNLLRKSNKIVVALPEQLNADLLASGLALRLFLIKLQKDVKVISSGKITENLKFLPGAELIESGLGAEKSLVISLDVKAKKLEELSYQIVGDKAHIYLRSKDEPFLPEDLSFSNEKFPVDLVICLGAASLESFGKLYEQNADLFFETPKINIDHSSNNEYFGQLNLVDLTATSVAEVLFSLLQKYEEQLVDEDIATCLLTGIVASTKSFQHVKTTPKAFLKASELVSLGGRQQEIVKNIFKTKSLPLLKLWGRALARIKTDESSSVVYSILNPADFEKSAAGREELLPALKEFIDNTSSYQTVALLAQVNEDLVKLLVATHERASAEGFLGRLNSRGKILNGKIGNYQIIEAEYENVSPEEVEKQFLEALKNA